MSLRSTRLKPTRDAFYDRWATSDRMTHAFIGAAYVVLAFVVALLFGTLAVVHHQPLLWAVAGVAVLCGLVGVVVVKVNQDPDWMHAGDPARSVVALATIVGVILVVAGMTVGCAVVMVLPGTGPVGTMICALLLVGGCWVVSMNIRIQTLTHSKRYDASIDADGFTLTHNGEQLRVRRGEVVAVATSYKGMRIGNGERWRLHWALDLFVTDETLAARPELRDFDVTDRDELIDPPGRVLRFMGARCASAAHRATDELGDLWWGSYGRASMFAFRRPGDVPGWAWSHRKAA